jgi:hypothetical protein
VLFPAESTYVTVPERQGFFSPLSFLRRPMFVVSVKVTGCSDLKNEPGSRGGFRTFASPFLLLRGLLSRDSNHRIAVAAMAIAAMSLGE